MRKNNKRKGFTIVELVIVIAVIAILAAVMIPTISGVIADANEAADKADARTLYTEYVNYQVQNGAAVLENVKIAFDEENCFSVANGQIVLDDDGKLDLDEIANTECIAASGAVETHVDTHEGCSKDTANN